jgi:(E)-4-hydroxy-3-methylbut-2-enyl-diphosphate synthase
MAIDAGINGLRLNPGNIRQKRVLKEVIKAAAENNVPIRVGVNAGSIARDVRKKHGGAVPQALVESAMEHINILEDVGFGDIKISLKASDVLTTVESYRLMRKKRDYPLHLGITEAGTAFSGLIKSSVGLGILLSEGIGDTIRVSLAADPVEEIRAAYGILGSLGLRQRGLNVVACPTCARRGMDVVKIADQVERKLQDMITPLSIAVMGCQVNGPGEARHADLGVVGLESGIQIYVKGKRRKKVLAKNVVQEIVAMARKLANEK